MKNKVLQENDKVEDEKDMPKKTTKKVKSE